ncbi:MAG: ferredoxin-thioredoxin reductase catalytic domain-containing protein [Spirochaetota bacterium]
MAQKTENPSAGDIDALYLRLKNDAEKAGYSLNPDAEFAKALAEGLIINGRRYGYPACPCRLASGVKDDDLDMICPCDYRDPDLTEYGACYCGLYVSEAIAKGEQALAPIPERRPADPEKRKRKAAGEASLSGLSYPVWRCTVCGYLCAREEPPALCPICKVPKERFERFI